MGKGKAKGFRPPRAGDANVGMLFGSAAHLTGDTVASPVQLREEGRAIPTGHPNFGDEWGKGDGKGKGPTGANSIPVGPKAMEMPPPKMMPASAKGASLAAAGPSQKEEPKVPAPASVSATPSAPSRPAVAITPTLPTRKDGLSEIERRRAALSEVERRRAAMLERERASQDGLRATAEVAGAACKGGDDAADSDACKEEADADQIAEEADADEIAEEDDEEDEVARAAARRQRAEAEAEAEDGEGEEPEAKRPRDDAESKKGEGQGLAMKLGLQDWAARINALAEGDTAIAQRCRDFVRKRILRAHTEGNLHCVDWGEEPVPSVAEMTEEG